VSVGVERERISKVINEGKGAHDRKDSKHGKKGEPVVR